ncbi:hypothetical protein Celal_0689 [Cellulophaga algicola DSM 14237]|uniref:DUF4145 domain-containing protein n=1 Tax=Cellulophaga algicola (strain DSM 14237 / IC166 / ACAM 630) TaxID=688270 RepID=E6XDB5_CELAD|nr:DUF4145 domain-containing protein [Cellulophaga algicola]ADV48028.1 hypothetical protein Celal_0689 [Cellulophaga algicola DSM 14237]
MKKKYFCRNCKGIRNQSALHKVEKRGGDDDGYFQWVDKYFIIECNGCETISFLNIYGNTEMTEPNEEGYQDYYDDEFIYPYSLEKSYEIETLSYLPEKIRIIYSETINALKANSYILTAGGLRAIIEALCNYLKIRKDNLEERINLLNEKGHLTVSESKRLHSIRFLGNDALHEIAKPKKEHLYILLDIINHLLVNLFVNDKKIKGQIETQIDSYEDFLRLIKNKINKEMIDKEYSLNQIIDKSKRLFPKGKIAELEVQLIEEINKNNLTFLKIVTNGDNTNYKVIEVPSTFDFGIF